MTDETEEENPVEATEEQTTEPSIEVAVPRPVEFSYDELCENFSEEMILADLEEVVKNRIRSLYDNQAGIRQQIAEAQKAQQAQQAGGPGGL
jgi:hypothetical protein